MATEKDLLGGADKKLVGGKVADKEEERRIVHLDDNLLAKIIAVHLPSMAAYRWRAVAKAWSGFTNEPSFLKHHLALGPLKLDEKPAALLLQPRAHARLGYVHALVVGLRDDAMALVDFSLHPEFEYLAAAPAPTPADAPEPAVPLPDYIAFFDGAARGLDLSIVGSHGRLLLARSSSCYVVGFPARNRFIKLPPPPSTPNLDSATSLRYELLDPAEGIIFRVLVLRADGGNITVDTFSSASGTWESRELGVHTEAFLFVRPESPGISTGQRHYWLDGQSRDRVLVYDEVSGTASVLRESPTQQGWRRLGRALGSVDLGAKLRFSAFDSFDPEQANPQPHALNGAYTVWTLNAAGAWERELHQTRSLSAHCFGVPYGAEIPFDFAGAAASSSIAVKNGVLLHRDLHDDQTKEIFQLTVGMPGRIGNLYRDCDVFPLFL